MGVPDIGPLAEAGRPSEIAVEDHDHWQRARAGDDRARRQLIERHVRLARMLALKVYARRTHNDHEFDDYLQLARIGLIQSVDRFDPSLGLKFETFASKRIIGSVLNGIESMSEKQQQIAARQRLLRGQADDGAGVLLALARNSIGLAVAVALEGSGQFVDGDPLVPDEAFEGAVLRQTQRRLHQQVRGLPVREHQVIRDHYFWGRPFEAIARDLGVSRGRVSQLHRQALQRLAGQWQA